MIFFDKKVIFIHVPRCGGTTIERNLYFNEFGKHFNHKKTYEKNLYMGFIDKYSNKYQLDGLQHLTFENIKKIYPIETKNFYSFSFVRNPFSRAISLFCEIMSDRNILNEYMLINKDISFNFFLKLILKNPHTHWMPASKFFNNKNLNFIGRFENYQKDLKKVFKKNKLKLYNKKFSPKSYNEKINYLSFYDNKENIELVNEIYQIDLNRFGYNFEDFYIENEKKNKDKKRLPFKPYRLKRSILEITTNYLSKKKYVFFNYKKVLYCK